MMVEGKGLVIPAKEIVILTDAEINECRRVSDLRVKYRDYNLSSSPWKHGMNPSAVFLGTAGEIAFQKWGMQRGFNLEINLSLKPNGDGGYDFFIGKYRIDVKTESPKRLEFPSLIRRVAESGRLVRFCDFYVFCSLDEATLPIVNLLGFVISGDLVRFHKSPYKLARHWNVEVPKVSMRPMSRLAHFVNAVLYSFRYGPDPLSRQ